MKKNLGESVEDYTARMARRSNAGLPTTWIGWHRDEIEIGAAMALIIAVIFVLAMIITA